MEYRVIFGGCNCGCTPSQHWTIYSSSSRDAELPLARLYFEHRTYSGKYKISFEAINNSDPIDESQVIKITDNWSSLYNQIKETKGKIRSSLNTIKKLEEASKILMIEIPKNAREIIKKEENNIKLLNDELNHEANYLNSISNVSKSQTNFKVKTTGEIYDDKEPEEYEETFGNIVNTNLDGDGYEDTEYQLQLVRIIKRRK
jgi:hypothetical protein